MPRWAFVVLMLSPSAPTRLRRSACDAGFMQLSAGWTGDERPWTSVVAGGQPPGYVPHHILVCGLVNEGET